MRLDVWFWSRGAHGGSYENDKCIQLSDQMVSAGIDGTINIELNMVRERILMAHEVSAYMPVQVVCTAAQFEAAAAPPAAAPPAAAPPAAAPPAAAPPAAAPPDDDFIDPTAAAVDISIDGVELDIIDAFAEASPSPIPMVRTGRIRKLNQLIGGPRTLPFQGYGIQNNV